jgi:hypothetical protein
MADNIIKHKEIIEIGSRLVSVLRTPIKIKVSQKKP